MRLKPHKQARADAMHLLITLAEYLYSAIDRVTQLFW